MREDMLKLAERCEAATGPDRELDFDIAEACRLTTQNEFGDTALIKRGSGYQPLRLTASLDAAMTLYRRIPERVPANPRLAAAEGLRQRASQGKD